MLLQYEGNEANHNQNNTENESIWYWGILEKVCLCIISFAIGLLCVYLTIVFINYWNRNNIDERSLFTDEQIEQFQELQHQIEQQHTTNYPLCEEIIDGVKVRSLHSKCRAPESKAGRGLLAMGLSYWPTRKSCFAVDLSKLQNSEWPIHCYMTRKWVFEDEYVLKKVLEKSKKVQAYSTVHRADVMMTFSQASNPSEHHAKGMPVLSSYKNAVNRI